MRRTVVILLAAVVGIGLLPAVPGGAAGRGPRHRAIVFSGQGNNLDAYESVPPFRHQRVITTSADDPKGLDINAQICFFPGGTTGPAGSSPARTPGSRTRRRAGGSSS